MVCGIGVCQKKVGILTSPTTNVISIKVKPTTIVGKRNYKKNTGHVVLDTTHTPIQLTIQPSRMGHLGVQKRHTSGIDWRCDRKQPAVATFELFKSSELFRLPQWEKKSIAGRSRNLEIGPPNEAPSNRTVQIDAQNAQGVDLSTSGIWHQWVSFKGNSQPKTMFYSFQLYRGSGFNVPFVQSWQCMLCSESNPLLNIGYYVTAILW